jgi:hypothetical protein
MVALVMDSQDRRSQRSGAPEASPGHPDFTASSGGVVGPHTHYELATAVGIEGRSVRRNTLTGPDVDPLVSDAFAAPIGDVR